MYFGSGSRVLNRPILGCALILFFLSGGRTSTLEGAQVKQRPQAQHNGASGAYAGVFGFV
jgi:hypothetical protein